MIDAVIGHARAGEGAVAAVPVSDTLKEAGADDPTRVERTRSRDASLAGADAAGFPPRRAGAGPRPCARGPPAPPTTLRWSRRAAFRRAAGARLPRNLKITTREDLALAEAARRRGPMMLPFRPDAEIDAAIPVSRRASRARQVSSPIPPRPSTDSAPAPTVPALDALARLKGRPRRQAVSAADLQPARWRRSGAWCSRRRPRRSPRRSGPAR